MIGKGLVVNKTAQSIFKKKYFILSERFNVKFVVK